MAGFLVRRAAPLSLALLALLVLVGSAHATTLTVSSTADTGGGSLRDTIAAAGANDTVFLPARADHYRVTSAEIVINNKPGLTVQGAGAAGSVVEGDDNNRILRTIGTTGLTVRGLTITRGSVTGAGSHQGGGAIFHDGAGALTVFDSTFPGNRATATSLSNNGGAAIYVNNGALSITGSSFSGNVFTQTAGPFNNGGGAVYQNSGSITIAASSFTGNSANVSGAQSNNGGGAVYQNGGSITIASSSFTGNSTNVTATATNNGGGAIYQNGSPVDISDSAVNGNTATVSSSNSTNGGGGLYQNGGNTTLTRSAMDGNKLTLTGGTVNNGGGGLYSNGGGTLTVSQSSVSGNSSATGGATGSSGGGGIYDNSNVDTTTITNSTLSNNTASPVGGGTGSGGGAIRRNGGTAPAIASTTIAGNSTNGRGGGVLNDGTGFSLKDTILAGNSATTGPNCSAGTVTSQGNNIDDGTSCGLAPGTDKPSTNPLLGPLADHGGGSSTQMLLTGSPAIGAGAGCPLTDQRGVARPQVGACDIGAVEVEPPLVSTVGASSLTPTGALLGASVEPRFSATAVHFDFGRTTGYGKTSGTGTSAPAGSAQTVSVAVGGLTKHTLYHFRAVGSNATGVPVVGQDKTFRTPSPVTKVSKFKLVPDVFAVGPGRTATTAKRHRGTSIRFTLSQASVVKIRIYRLLPGRRAGKRCKAPSRKLRSRKKCKRAKKVGTLTRRKAKKGKNKVKFSGRIGRKALKRGRYKATITATAPGAPRASKARSAKFRIVRG